MAALLMGLEKIGYLVSQCEIYECLYLRLHPTQPTKQSEQLSLQAKIQLEKAMTELYTHILQFLAKANRISEMKTLRKTVHAILNPGEVIDFIEKCTSLENRMREEVEICERVFDQQQNAESTRILCELRKLLGDLEQPIVRIDNKIGFMFEKLNSSEQSDILQWISNIPYEDNHLTARQGRTEGTGTWLLRHSQYLEWRKSSASMILWLRIS